MNVMNVGNLLPAAAWGCEGSKRHGKNETCASSSEEADEQTVLPESQMENKV